MNMGIGVRDAAVVGVAAAEATMDVGTVEAAVDGG